MMIVNIKVGEDGVEWLQVCGAELETHAVPFANIKSIGKVGKVVNIRVGVERIRVGAADHGAAEDLCARWVALWGEA